MVYKSILILKNSYKPKRCCIILLCQILFKFFPIRMLFSMHFSFKKQIISTQLLLHCINLSVLKYFIFIRFISNLFKCFQNIFRILLYKFIQKIHHQLKFHEHNEKLYNDYIPKWVLLPCLDLC